jgi:hypothetical protein
VRLAYADRVNAYYGSTQKLQAGNIWCLPTFAVKAIGPANQRFDPIKLSLVDDRNVAYNYPDWISLFHFPRKAMVTNSEKSIEGQIPYKLPTSAKAAYFQYVDDHWSLRIPISDEIAKQQREESAQQQRAEADRQRAEAQRQEAAERVWGIPIDYPTFFAKAKGTGLPLGKRYKFRAKVSHDFCLSDPDGYEHILCGGSQIDEDNSARLEQFLKGPDRPVLNVTAAMMEGRFGSKVTVLRLE